jgi:hypothetical protein
VHGEGVLEDKTVRFKDHVTGMSMSFGSFSLDGFIPDFDATISAEYQQLIVQLMREARTPGQLAR